MFLVFYFFCFSLLFFLFIFYCLFLFLFFYVFLFFSVFFLFFLLAASPVPVVVDSRAIAVVAAGVSVVFPPAGTVTSEDFKGDKTAYKCIWECAGANMELLVAIAVSGKPFANRRSSHASS